MPGPLAAAGAFASSHPLVLAGGGVAAFALFRALQAPPADAIDPSGGAPAPTPLPTPGADFGSSDPSNVPTGPQDYADLVDMLTTALGNLGITPAPAPIPVPGPVVTPPPVGCGPKPATLGAQGEWQCIAGAWRWVFLAPSPTPSPSPLPTPTPTPIPRPVPSPTPAPTPAPGYPPGTYGIFRTAANPKFLDFTVGSSRRVTGIRMTSTGGFHLPCTAPAEYVTATAITLPDGKRFAAGARFTLVRLLGTASWSGHYVSPSWAGTTITRV